MNGSYLTSLNSVSDLKKLDLHELNILSQELREYILSVVSHNGGHLSSNLGVVELTVALEYVFNPEKDRLIWDVGHQCYAHKILTGRRDAFLTLRQPGGLSGFPKRAESICDAYDTGHSSTSIAAALGFAEARDMRGENHRVVAIIGDGSMTGGQAFEALNLAGELNTDILVVLNDNHMSIAPNVGGLSRYLTRLRASSAYTGSKQAVRRILSKVPFAGNLLIRIIEAVKGSLRYLLVNGVVFSELGFQYYGPVDGHNLKSLVEMLEQVKDLKGPVLLHVVTEKGKGYRPAMENATEYHGIAPFDLETGKTNGSGNSVPTYTEVFSQALMDLAREDPRIVAVTAAMADGTGLESFHRQYPSRFFDTGIAEQTAVTFSAALALSGFRPVVAVYSSFMQRAFDQLIMDAALQEAPVIFALDRSGIVGEDGPTHHGVYNLSYLNQIPNMAILLPRDEYMLSSMLRLAYNYEKGPAALCYPKGRGKGGAAAFYIEPETDGAPRWGEGQLLHPGSQALILAAGPLVYEGLAAASALEKEGYSVAVFDPCFLKPLDEAGIKHAAMRCVLTVTVEENVAPGGLGWTVTRLLSEAGYLGRIRTLCVPDGFVPHGDMRELRGGLGLDAQGIARAVKEELQPQMAESCAAPGHGRYGPETIGGHERTG